ncbi:MAG: 4Fe-4S dicluster domain-containing protein [bacterium]|nr:4Fe-4S dicluster domain-containing protein [bacterium]
MISIQLNDLQVECEQGRTILEVARAHGVEIPTLCHHPSLPPAGLCRLCIVEQEWPDGERSVKSSCTLQATDGMKILTDTDRVHSLRAGVIELLLLRAPHATSIRDLANLYGVEQPALTQLQEPDGCVLCGLCVRTCEQSMAREAITCAQRSTGRSVATAFHDRSENCVGCGSCVNVCPTGVLHLEQQDGVRRIFWNDQLLNETELVPCEDCGDEFTTRQLLDWTAQRGKPNAVDTEHPVCPACARQRQARRMARPLARY